MEHFKLFEKYAVSKADSLGMNEVEVQMLLDYWSGRLVDINEEKSTEPSLQTVLQLTAEMFNQAKKKELPLSRVHLHPYGSFMMCYAKDKWEDAQDAIIKGSIAVPKYCQMGNYNSGHSWLDSLDDYEVPDLPREIMLPNGKSIPVTPDSLTYSFDLDDDEESGIYCYLQFFIKCNKVFKTAGMGDTITATGWIYH